MKLLLLIPLIVVIAVNGLSTGKFPNGPRDHDYNDILDSSDEHLQRKEMNLVVSDEDSTDETEPLNTPSDGPNKTAQPSWDCESNGGECKKNKLCNGTISIEYTCSNNGVCCIVEVKAQSASELNLSMLSNAILIQGMAIQTLKVELTNAVEVMTSKLTNAISDQGVALQIMKNNLTRIGDLEIKLHTMESKIENLTKNLEYENANLNQKLDYIITKLNASLCSREFEIVSGQCLMFSNNKLTWIASKSECERLRSRLVVPTNFERLGISMQKKGLTSAYWVGASDQPPATHPNYEWLDGSRTPVSYRYWHSHLGPGQASGVHNGQSCVKIHFGPTAKLIAAGDTNCDASSTYKYICEEL